MFMPIRNTITTAAQPTQSTAEPASSEVTQSVPSASGNALHRLRWNLLVLVNHAIKNLSAAAVENFTAPAGTKIAFEGKIDQNAYVYLVQVAEPSRTVTRYPAEGETIQVTAGEATRIPAEGWLVVPTKGRIFAFSSPNPLSHEEIVAALDGREPPPGPAGDPDAKLAKFGKFSDPGIVKGSQGPLEGPENAGVASAKKA
ncbi:hypothetical protein WMF45_43215 [Sorangium sp. So ce448]|uniref:hypothetical protein n=1 Tax=Sorangium sp. So ce448 TaxID=3133314 RepID=UPI003F6015C6